jgi:hypothetical protein
MAGRVTLRPGGRGLPGGVPPLQLPEPDGGHDELGVDGVRIFLPADPAVMFAVRFHGIIAKQSAFQPAAMLENYFACPRAGALE